MPRKPRAFEAGAYYHVGSRGNNGEAIVRDDIDRMEFLRWYARVANTERWGVLAYVLMDNHYHFVVRSDESGLSRGMQLLNCGFTRRINRRHGRDGHLSANGFTAAGSRTTSICSRPAATSSSIPSEQVSALTPRTGRGAATGRPSAWNRLQVSWTSRICSGSSIRGRMSPGMPSAPSSPKATSRCQTPCLRCDGVFKCGV